ncbi:MAG: phosphatidylserine decarboxylase family protein [Planctomycetaceae bacterium]|nr:phosphatidylserine decarboxylase family protein [Planctomycetaceae bacterium]
MDPQLTCIQPGGGVVIKLELAWGHIRRWYLKTFRKSYVARMQESRHGEKNACPHEVLDPRDVKFYRNQDGYWWDEKDDPFTWRDRLPFARVGMAELLLSIAACFGGAAGLTALALTKLPGNIFVWLGVATLAVIGSLIVWFFRDPNRPIPTEPGLVISPADGKVVTIEDIEHDEFIGGPAVNIGIFLSIFNVHINRTPVAARVIGLRYKKGKMLNALRPESVRENEQLAIRIESTEPGHRRMIVRQITGAIARRIVCWLKPGDEIGRGDQVGMIKFGSRTELVIPKEDGLTIEVKEGQNVKAGRCVMARYSDKP